MAHRIEVGYADRSFGTIADGPHDFIYTGRDDVLRRITGRYRDAFPTLSRAELLDLILTDYRSLSWAKPVEGGRREAEDPLTRL